MCFVSTEASQALEPWVLFPEAIPESGSYPNTSLSFALVTHRYEALVVLFRKYVWYRCCTILEVPDRLAQVGYSILVFYNSEHFVLRNAPHPFLA